MNKHTLRNVRLEQGVGTQPYVEHYQQYRADGAKYAPVQRDPHRPKVWHKLIPALIVLTIVAAYIPPLWYFVGTIWFCLLLFWLFIGGHFWTFGGGDD